MPSTIKWKIAQKLELKWWQRYLKDKDVEEYISWKRNYWKGFLTDIDDGTLLLPGQRILDIGCGPAGLFIHLTDHDLTAVDPLLDRYEARLAHFSKASYPNNVGSKIMHLKVMEKGTKTETKCSGR